MWQSLGSLTLFRRSQQWNSFSFVVRLTSNMILSPRSLHAKLLFMTVEFRGCCYPDMSNMYSNTNKLNMPQATWTTCVIVYTTIATQDMMNHLEIEAHWSSPRLCEKNSKSMLPKSKLFFYALESWLSWIYHLSWRDCALEEMTAILALTTRDKQIASRCSEQQMGPSRKPIFGGGMLKLKRSARSHYKSP